MSDKRIDLPTGLYGILIRHNGFVDRYARQQPHPYYTEADINAWPTDDVEKMLSFKSRKDAEAKAATLVSAFGEDGYRFEVIEQRLVPRWFPCEGR